MMRLRRRLATAGLAALSLTGVAACTGQGTEPAPTQRALTPAERLAAAKSTLDAATSVHLKLASANVPQGASGVVSADGWGKHPPAFKGTFTLTLKGVSADAQVTSVGGQVWAKLPLVPGTNKIDPKTFGVPDPATLFSPDAGLTTLLTATTAPTAGSDVRQGSEVLKTITGSLPGSAVADLFLVGDRNATFATTYGLTDAQQLRQVSIVGPFFGPGTSSTYTLTLDQYGAPVTIETP